MNRLLFVMVLSHIVLYSFSQEIDSIRKYEIDEVLVVAARTNTPLRNIPQKVEIIDETELYRRDATYRLTKQPCKGYRLKQPHKNR